MIRVFAVLLTMGVLMMGVGASAWAGEDDGSQIKILSPENGAVIKGDTVEVQYMLVKGAKSTHVHVYVDGKYQKGFTGLLKNLTPGKHEIKLVASDPDHHLLAVEAVIMIDIR
ncbi:MAG TPA: hypothetical protein VIR79_01535 [Nitrospira sp.]